MPKWSDLEPLAEIEKEYWTVVEHPEHGCYCLAYDGEIVQVFGPEAADGRDARWRARMMNMPLMELEQISVAIDALGTVFR